MPDLSFPSRADPTPEVDERTPLLEERSAGEDFGRHLDVRTHGPEDPFPFERLPPETRQNVLQQAAMFPDRGEANAAIQNFRQSSRASKHLIDHTPLRYEAAVLQDHPGVRDRGEAAREDFDGGMGVLQALADHHVTDQTAIDALKLAGARDEIDSGDASVAEAIHNNRLTNQDDIRRLWEEEARRNAGT